MKNDDLVGQKIGKLLVIKNIGIVNKQTRYECNCECGSTNLICTYHDLNTRKVISCGCSKKPDLIGKKYGKLTPIKLYGKYLGHWMYQCKCECGNLTIAGVGNLKKGNVKSCGCLRHESNKKTAKIANKNPRWNGCGEISGTYWKNIRGRASKDKSGRRKLNITIEQAWDIFLKQDRKCALSGLDIKFASNSVSSDGTASLDRIDSLKPYTIDNVQWIHKDINSMKSDLPENLLVKYCEHIYKNSYEKDSRYFS